jgi:hypothetical protein
MDKGQTSTATCDPLGSKPHPLDKANAVAVCLDNQFRTLELYKENHERRVET